MVRLCDAYLSTGEHRPTPHHHGEAEFSAGLRRPWPGQRLAQAREEVQRGRPRAEVPHPEPL